MHFIWIFVLLGAYSAQASTVQTNYGMIEGATVTLYNGEKVDAFLGIPYATPPIGLNRFAPPQKPTPWNRTLETKAVSKGCYQAIPDELKGILWFLAEGPESEDCLFLNVWKPSNWQEPNMTVMVWIHPGGLFAGSASMPLYDGGILANRKKVIVVSMNYRLSMFGGLFLNSPEAPGNVGLQDQILAMKWVNENIYYFGGDPKRVTIFGESAGSVSVSLHVVNPDISNLFQYGIMESGSLYMDCLSFTKELALNYSFTLGESLGCPINDTQELINCLRGKNATDVIQLYKYLPEYGHFPFSPVRNGKEVPLNPILSTKDIPINKRKNLLAGNIPGEGPFFTSVYIPGKFLTDDLVVTESDMRAMLSNYLLLNDTRLQNVVRDKYRDNDSPYNKSQLRNEFGNLITDNMFICPDTDFVKDYSSNGNNVFYYQFNYRPSKSILSPIPEWVGPTHGDGIPFFFGLPLDPKNGYNDADRHMSKEMMNYYVNFAKKGNPNGHGQVIWTPHKPNCRLRFLEFNNFKTRMSKFRREEQCAFWRDIYPDLLNIQEELDNTTDF